ncbi:MAG: hypothetical protein JWQ89_2941 [Devosia sp.]|uniref:DUF192 domain-containing protein n=1 Tax=Devosia sp. TaxID=1871048 RepID=UPI00260F0CD2|nr:DUF192 domain-containing protein [Devosia sp.]MDB5541214.1 hypothetical protein [Devosia sp.]
MHILIKALTGAFLLLALLPLGAQADDTHLTIQSTNGDHAFTVEVVDTPEARAKGLMLRRSLAPDAGMLFDFKESRPVSFWMSNTLIPLDMVFIKADGTVANIHADARPMDLTSIPSEGPVMFVLEIPGGRAAELGLAPGDHVVHDRIKSGT